MASQKNSKKEAQTRHAKRRAMERYDIDFTHHKRQTMLNQIHNGDGQFIRRQSHRVSIWAMICDNKEVVIVYDKERNNIVSFLPLEAKEKDIFMGNL